jgi:beta-phosphoglucomutase family hydrolase
MTLQAVIWDMDGVIADTGSYHCRAWQIIFGKRGIEFTEAHFMSHFGQRNDTIIRDTAGQDISPEELEVIAEEKEATYRELVAGNIKPLPGAIELIRQLRERGVKTAIGSSAPPPNVDIVLRGLGILDWFDAIACGREVTEGKPSPQVFLLAAGKLGVAPANCLVVEDAIAGVAAARRAGMKCLAVTNSHGRQALVEADLVVDTLEGVGYEELAALFKK